MTFKLDVLKKYKSQTLFVDTYETIQITLEIKHKKLFANRNSVCLFQEQKILRISVGVLRIAYHMTTHQYCSF